METPEIRISIYEDNIKLRELLVLLINNTSGYKVTGDYSNCSNILSEIRLNSPDVIVMDIDMPQCNGMDGVRMVKEYDFNIKVLMHTVFDDEEKLFKCLSNGADEYLLKKDSSLHLIPYIHEVYEGGGPMSPGIARRVLQTFHQPLKPIENSFHISSREKQVLELLARGFSYRMIALEYKISIETVRKHLKNIYQKLHVQCGTEAVAKAIKEKIIQI